MFDCQSELNDCVLPRNALILAKNIANSLIFTHQITAIC